MARLTWVRTVAGLMYSFWAISPLVRPFGPGFNGPLDAVGQVNSPADHARFAAFLTAARGEPGVAAVTATQLSPNGKAEVAEVFPTTGPQDAATTTVLDRLRAGVPQAAWIPALMFAVLFGLSTDYEAFLISRMHEEWALSGDNKRAVIRGQAETGRVITAASMIMILVFAAFILTGQVADMQIGLGFAAAIFVDAYIIRTVLVPSVMHMLGRANW